MRVYLSHADDILGSKVSDAPETFSFKARKILSKSGQVGHEHLLLNMYSVDVRHYCFSFLCGQFDSRKVASTCSALS